MRKNIFSYLAIAAVVALPVLAFTSVARSEGEPVITSISPIIGPAGTMVTIKGFNFTLDDNIVDWGFGRTSIFATGAPGEQTITVMLRENCTVDEGCIEMPKPGYVDIKVTNIHGASNVARFLVTTHGGGCYRVDNFDTPTETFPVSCDSDECNAGNCTPDPTPSPSPAPASPTPTPSPTPTVSDEDEDNDDNDEDSGSNITIKSITPTTGKVKGASESFGPSAADRAAGDFMPNNEVVLTVDRLYRQAYGYKPGVCGSDFWKQRARSDKATESKLLGAMLWNASRGKNPAYASCVNRQLSLKNSSPAGEKVQPADINSFYRATHEGVNPTVAQNQYWLGRMKDKVTRVAMLGAMAWHFLQGTGF